MGMAKDIETSVIDVVACQFGIEQAELSRDTSFLIDLNADSLDLVELIMEFEEEFNLNIPDSDFDDKIHTVGEAIDYIKDVYSNAIEPI